MRRKSQEMALCGVLSALAVVILFLGGLIPPATYCAPMLAIVVLVPILVDCGPKMAGTSWAAVSLLAMLLVPNWELTLFYVFFGFYPLLRSRVQSLRSPALRLLCKLAYCSLSTLAIYVLLIFLMGLEAVAADFQGLSLFMALFMLVMDNINFLLLDALVERFSIVWETRLRKRFFSR